MLNYSCCGASEKYQHVEILKIFKAINFKVSILSLNSKCQTLVYAQSKSAHKLRSTILKIIKTCCIMELIGWLIAARDPLANFFFHGFCGPKCHHSTSVKPPETNNVTRHHVAGSHLVNSRIIILQSKCGSNNNNTLNFLYMAYFFYIDRSISFH